MANDWYIIEGINPLPWVASEGAMGRTGGKLMVQFYKSEALNVYQASVKDEMQRRFPDAPVYPSDAPFGLEFWLWRQLEEGEYETRRGKKKTADATNMQKALEDALQGILYKNDRQVSVIRTMVVEQTPTTEPCILIRVFDVDQSDLSLSAENLRQILHDQYPQPDETLDVNRGYQPPDERIF